MGVSGISCLGNVLMLTGPLFMMLVYNKVLTSKSMPTLVALCLLALLLYCFYGFLEGLRGKLMARVGITFDHKLAPSLFLATLRLPLHFGPHARQYDPLQDLATIRNFLMGGGPSALLDLPWIPLYFAILYIVHPLLAAMAVAGAALLVALSVVNQMLAKAASRDARPIDPVDDEPADGRAPQLRGGRGDEHGRRPLQALGRGLRERHFPRPRPGRPGQPFRRHLQGDAAGAAIGHSGARRLSRHRRGHVARRHDGLLHHPCPRARPHRPGDRLFPRHRRGLAGPQASEGAVGDHCPRHGRSSTACRVPARSLSVRDIAIAPPGGATATVAGVSFEIESGDALGVIGPSGCGKSTLVRALVGAWPTARGEIRFDDAMISHYSAEILADAIGHLPQSIELFDGTIAENIARFRKDATTGEVIEAAQLAGVHEMILSFPKGYDTPVGEGGMTLSGGQRQRIGLARAVFGDPFLVVLDEPNSNLDPVGEQSLNEAIQRMRLKGQIVVIVAHRPSAIFAANKILSLRNGRAEMFGSKKHVLAALFPRAGQPHKPAEVVNGGESAAPAPVQAAPSWRRAAKAAQQPI